VAAPVQPSREAFELRETISLSESAVASDGRILLNIIRPGVGRGKGRHLYEANMLARDAHKFAGWKMFVDHQSEQARRVAGGLPRSVRDLGGRITESWWNPDVPAEGRFGRGAIQGWVRPTRFVRDLVEDDPELVEASINARATAVRPGHADGQRVWVVEGLDDRGSIDWVTEGGAGGRVASLLESAYHADETEELALLESMTDQELVAHLRDSRPELLEALTQDEQPPAAVSASAEALREALLSEQGREVLAEILEAALDEERALTRAEALAYADRQIQLRDLRDQAQRQIREAGLTGGFESDLIERFTMTDSGPSEELDVVDDIDENGEVVKRVEDKLKESVDQAIKTTRERIREAAPPTRVRGQGPTQPTEVVEGAEQPPRRTGRSLWREQLQEAGFENPDEAYN
jgi:hypothetical protein